MFGDCHRQQEIVTVPQVVVGKLIKEFSYSFGFAKNKLLLQLEHQGGIPRARMNGGNQLQLQVSMD